MSLGWKRFNFYDQQARPDASVFTSSTCSCSSASQAWLGDESGAVRPHTYIQQACFGACSSMLGQFSLAVRHPAALHVQVTVIDRTLKQETSFQAHAGPVRHVLLAEVICLSCDNMHGLCSKHTAR